MKLLVPLLTTTTNYQTNAMRIIIGIIGLLCLPLIMFGQIGSSDIGHTDIAQTTHFKDTTAVSQILLPSKKSENCCYRSIHVDNSASCQDVTVQLDNNGNGSTTANAVYNDPSNNGIASLTLSQTNFDCTDVGPNTVTLTITDVNGNISTCTATVTVEDNIAPTAVCQNFTVPLNANGHASITAADVETGSSDNCGTINLISVIPNTFDCSNIGPNNVTLTINDGNGNTNNCTAIVTVEDNTAPTAGCQNITAQLNANGQASITAADVESGSSDNCGTINLVNVIPNTFDCSNIGPNNVTMTINDGNGNTNNCNTIVTIEDNIAPTVGCQNITAQLNANGQASITVADVESGSSDNCGTVNLVGVIPYTFDCSNIGPNNVTLTINDGNGNTNNCNAIVTIEDNIEPVLICSDQTVNLSSPLVTYTSIIAGSTDNCSDINQFSPNTLSYEYNCSDVGVQAETLIIEDADGNVASCTFDVTVVDDIAPTAACQNTTIQLDGNGNGTMEATSINNGSTDNCGITSLSLDDESFTCANVGNNNTVTLTVTDTNGNISNCTATVTVEDNNIPTAQCLPSVDLELTSDGTTVLRSEVIDNGSFNSCGSFTLSLSQTDFDCDDINEAIIVTLAIQDDDNLLSSSCQTTVNVSDPNSFCCQSPTVVCNDLTIQLDANGIGSTTPSVVGAGSLTDCGLLSETITQENFTCADVGVLSLTYTITDINNEQASCNATITVEDNIAPIAACKNTAVEIQSDGTYTLQQSDVFDNINSSDNCIITQVHFPATIYTCNEVGNTFAVPLTISDAAGNTANCTANIQVLAGDDLPDGWSSNDLGLVTIGNEYAFDPCTYSNPANGEFTITGSGNNATSSTTDNVAFAYQTLCGDGSITAKIESISPNGYGGLMIRETSDPGSKQVAIFSNLTNILRHETRYTANGPKQVNSFFKPSPWWLRLERQGDWIFAYYSTTGTTFTYVHAVFVPMQDCIQIGLASFTYLANQQTDAVFSNVNITGSSGSFSANNDDGLANTETPKHHNTEIPQYHNIISPHHNITTSPYANIALFPNPNMGSFTIQLNEPIKEQVTIFIYNQYGQQMYNQQMQKGPFQLDLSLEELPSGTYWLKMSNKKEVLATKVFVISK